MSSSVPLGGSLIWCPPAQAFGHTASQPASDLLCPDPGAHLQFAVDLSGLVPGWCNSALHPQTVLWCLGWHGWGLGWSPCWWSLELLLSSVWHVVQGSLTEGFLRPPWLSCGPPVKGPEDLGCGSVWPLYHSPLHSTWCFPSQESKVIFCQWCPTRYVPQRSVHSLWAQEGSASTQVLLTSVHHLQTNLQVVEKKFKKKKYFLCPCLFFNLIKKIFLIKIMVQFEGVFP